MSPGKTAAQAAHAARLSLLHYLKINSGQADEFIARNACGTVVVLSAKNLWQLEESHARAKGKGLPTALFTDSGHIPQGNPHFDGRPVVTALAIGPARRQDIHPITKKYRCMR